MPTPQNTSYLGCLSYQKLSMASSGVTSNEQVPPVLFPQSFSGQQAKAVYDQAQSVLIGNTVTGSMTQQELEFWKYQRDTALETIMDSRFPSNIDGSVIQSSEGLGQVCQPDDGPIQLVSPLDEALSAAGELALYVGADLAGVGETVWAQQAQAAIGLVHAVGSLLPPFQFQSWQAVPPIPQTPVGASVDNAQMAAISQQLGTIGANLSAGMPAPGQTFVPPVGDAQVTAAILALSTSIVWSDNPNFRIMEYGQLDQEDPGQPFYDGGLLGIGPEQNAANEPDVDMLNRLAPYAGWVLGAYRPFVTAQYFLNVSGNSCGVTLMYCPVNQGYLSPTSLLQQFFHLWDYTPDSGPPTRNGITDFMRVLSMLPIQFPP